MNKSELFLIAALLLIAALVLGFFVSVVLFVVLGLFAGAAFVLALQSKTNDVALPFIRRKLRRAPTKIEKPRPISVPPPVAFQKQAETHTHPVATPYFVGVGAETVVGPHRLGDPLIYVVDAASYLGADASLICLQRPVGVPRIEGPKALGYWPHLSETLPHQFGNYLQWLAGGRQDSSVDLGYVFLYFYGLERRSLIDGQDIVPIAQEVVRLIGIYGSSRSFRGYATRLLAHLVMIRRLKPTPKLISKLLNLQGDYIEPELSTLLLGYLALERQPLTAEWAMRLAAQDERAKRSVVQERAPEEVSRLFFIRYKGAFGDGLVPIVGAVDVVLSYRAASPSLLPHNVLGAGIPIARWPAVQGWRRQFSPVVDIWNECIEELRGFARKADSAGRDAVVTFELLPEELRKERDHPLLSAWDRLLAEFSTETGAILLPVGRIAKLRELEPRPKLTQAQSRGLAELADSLGSPLEPDARYTKQAYAWDEHVAALRLPEVPVLPNSQNFNLASIILRLALEVAKADGVVDEDERRVMREFLGERFMLNRNELLRLEALVEVLLKNDSSLSGLKKILSSKFTEDQRKAIGKYLVNLAVAARGIVPEEVRALERSFRSLGLDPGTVAGFLEELGDRGPERPVVVATAGDEKSRGEVIPPPEKLDLDRIRRLRAESDDVAKLLLEAMSEVQWEDSEDAGAPVSTQSAEPAPPSGASVLNELPEAIRTIVLELVKRESWPKDEFNQLARQHGKSAAATVEEINGWSDERLGDFLLEDGDTVKIRHDLWARVGGSK